MSAAAPLEGQVVDRPKRGRPPKGRFAQILRPSLEMLRPVGAAPWRPAPDDELPKPGLQWFIRRGVESGFHDAGDGLSEHRGRRMHVIRTIAYARWLDGATVAEIARDFGWSIGTTQSALTAARKSMSTLKVVHDAIARLDRVGVPLAVDAILKAVRGGDVESAFKLLGGRQVLVKSNVNGDELARGTDPTGPAIHGLTINILPANNAKPVTLGTIVGAPLTGAPEVLEGEVAR